MAVFCKRRRKFITPFVLALWLFAIFVSVAHACGLDKDLGYAGLNEPVNIAAHDGSDDGASPSCDEFCADDYPVLAKLKSVQDPPTDQALLVPTVAGDTLHTATAPVSPLLASPDPPPGIAVNTRFVRLAL